MKKKRARRCREIPRCEWKTPAILPEIIAVEHAAAVRDHVAFFDTFATMGGADQMGAWAEADPKVAYKDHVHFTDLGYARWADALSDALIAGYAAWRRAQNLPPTQPVLPPEPPPAAGSGEATGHAQAPAGLTPVRARASHVVTRVDAVLESRLPAVPDRRVLPVRAVALRRGGGTLGPDRADGAARRRRVRARRQGSGSRLGSDRKPPVARVRRPGRVADRDARVARLRGARGARRRDRGRRAVAAGSRASAASAWSRVGS